ncbi:hypothetical protein NHF46_02620 [Arthrobacter alpinus]|nr:hypothetical protein [Arthrobacter alpinus]
MISEAVVKGFPAEDRAMVELVPSGEQALIRSEDLLPGIPLDWLVAKAQLLSGTLDPATHVLNIGTLLLPARPRHRLQSRRCGVGPSQSRLPPPCHGPAVARQRLPHWCGTHLFQ